MRLSGVAGRPSDVSLRRLEQLRPEQGLRRQRGLVRLPVAAATELDDEAGLVVRNRPDLRVEVRVQDGNRPRGDAERVDRHERGAMMASVHIS